MPCYHPLIGIPTGETTVNGKKKLFIRDLRNSGDAELELKKNKDAVLIPCGRCFGCRLDYSRQWADRMMLELETEKKAVFLTLTYDNEHITWCKFDEDGYPLLGTLVKRDFQLFMKRLRKHYANIRFRFFLAGEYGDKTKRPHGHCILYGISLSDFSDLVYDGKNELGNFYYRSEELENIWSNGRVCVADVNWKTCAYVARYVCKKLNGRRLEERVNKDGQLQEFCLMSRKPGLGKEYLNQNPDCLDKANINISTPEGGLKISIPKYYLKQLELTNPEMFVKLKEERKRFSSDRTMIELSKTNLSLIEYLENKEMNIIAKAKALLRNKV